MSDLPKGWASATVGDLFRTLGGGTPSTSVREYWSGDIPWATSADIGDDLRITPRKTVSQEGVDASATNVVPRGSVIVASRVALGKAAVSFRELCFSQDCRALIVEQDLFDSEFVAHQMGLRLKLIRGRGTTISGITKKQLIDTEFYVPPLSEQRRIVAAIESQFRHLDGAVESLRRAYCNIARLRAAILKDAVEGRLVHKSTSRMAADTLLDRILKERRATWSRSGKNTRYREPTLPRHIDRHNVPKQWAICSVDSVGEIQLGRQRSPKNHQGSHMRPYLRAANVTWNGIDLSDIKEMNFAPEELKRYKLIKGDILLNEASGSADEVGKPAIWGGEIEDCCFQNTLLRVRPSNLIDRKYLWLTLLHAANNGGFSSVAKGVNILHLGKANLASWPVPLPSLDEQCRIVAEVERQFASLDTTGRLVDTAIARAASLRQAVLLEALAGRLIPRNFGEEPDTELLEHIQTHEASR